MAAPAGLSSGSAPDPLDPQTAEPEPVATEPLAIAPEAAEPEAAAPQAAAPQAAEPEAADRAGPGRGESTVAVLGLDPQPADTEPAGDAAGAGRIRPLAVAALIFSIIALVGAAVAVLAVVTHGFKPKTIVTYRPAPAVFSLRAGDCINSAPNGLSATVLSCASPHDAEVFATFSLTGSSWPGDAIAQQQAANGCASMLGGYLNPALANAGFAQEYVYPDKAAWQAGVRTVICEIRASSGQLTGSVRQGG
jgi:Septum formation